MPNKVTYKRFSAFKGDLASWALGIGLGLTVAMQLTTMRKSDIDTLYAALGSLSRLAALVGTYFALVGIFMIARIPWVEKSIGHDRLVVWHRKLGPWSLYLIGSHVLFITISYAGFSQISLVSQFWQILNDFGWMWFALAGFFLMIFAGITSYKKARATMSYETWWILHVFTYGAMAASFMHQIVNGQMFIGHPLNRAYWIALYVAMAFCVIWWRIVKPAVLSIKHRLVIDKVVKEGPGVYSIIFKGRRLRELGAEGGQFFNWRFTTKGHRLLAHPYSLSAAPTDEYMRISVKNLGDHSRATEYLRLGTKVWFEGPYGAFTAGRTKSKRAVLIGGGVGITPIRALLDEFKDSASVDVLFRAPREEDLILREELDYIASKSHGTVRVHYMAGPRKKFPMDAPVLGALIPDIADAEIYICGPLALIETVVLAAKELGVSATRVHHEEFVYHAV